PLLRIAAAEILIDGEDSLSQTGIRSDGKRRHRWSIGKYECGIDVIERALRNCLDKRKLRDRERRGDTGLLDPDHGIARARHGLVVKTIGQTQPWSKITFM